MNTCQTCRFWTAHQWRFKAEEFKDWNWCELAENLYDETTPHPDAILKAEDAESYHALLRTHKDFGCNQYAHKL